MVLSETTNKSGLVQRVEFWTRLPYGSANNTLREIINGLNRAFEKIMPILLVNSDFLRWDDQNHTDAPIGYTNLVSGQSDYKFTEDDNSLDILNITNVRIKLTSSATDYSELERMTVDDERAVNAMSPNSVDVGIPSHFVEVGNRLYLYPEPNYSATNGIEIFFGREQAYFTVTGTSGADTTEPGIPKPFHELLALHSAYDYISVHRPNDGNSLTLISTQIKKMERDLKNFIDLKHPTKVKMTMAGIKYR